MSRLSQSHERLLMVQRLMRAGPRESCQSTQTTNYGLIEFPTGLIAPHGILAASLGSDDCEQDNPDLLWI